MSSVNSDAHARHVRRQAGELCLAPATCSRSSSTTRWSMKLHAAGTCGDGLRLAARASGFITGSTFNIADLFFERFKHRRVWAVRRRRIRLYVPGSGSRSTGTSPTVTSSLLPSSQGRGCAGALRCAAATEQLRSRQFASQSDAFFVDASLSYRGRRRRQSAASDHLEGKTVSISGRRRRASQAGFVTSSAITLDQAASVVPWACPMFPTSKPAAGARRGWRIRAGT